MSTLAERMQEFQAKYAMDLNVSMFLAGDRREPDDWLEEIHARILLTSLDGDPLDDDKLDAGKIVAFWVRINQAQEDGVSVYDVLDAHSGDAEEYCCLLTGAGDWVPLIQETFEPYEGNLLIINTVQINECYRGGGLGLWAVRRLIDSFQASCGLVVMHPWPIGPDGPLNADKLGREGQIKLQRYWARLGFRPVRFDPPDCQDIFALSTTYNAPTIEEIMRSEPPGAAPLVPAPARQRRHCARPKIKKAGR
jgi:hypothetical protein